MGLVKVKQAIVAGCGEFGMAAADKLSSSGYAVTVVDRDEAAFGGLSASYGGQTVSGDAADVAVLEDCDIRNASLLISCTDRDSVNYFIAQVASEVYGVEHVFARIEDKDLIELLEDSTVESICPHELCLGEFCRLSRLG